MSANEFEQFTVEEARARWMALEEELPIGPRKFLELCAAHRVAVPPKHAEALLAYVSALYARGNKFGFYYCEGVDLPKRLPDLGRVARELSLAIDGIIPESQLKLRVNMVPKALYGENLRKYLPRPAWSQLRKSLIEERGAGCEICGAVIPSQSDVDAHEEWEYNTYKRPVRAILTGIKLVCARCHATVHFGLQFGLVQAGKVPVSHLEQIEAHFCAVNGVGAAMFNLHLNSAIDRWGALNRRRSWRLEFGSYQPLVVASAVGSPK